jgi:hypothetical protein
VCHPQWANARAQFVEIGQKFVSFMGVRHMQYDELVIYQNNDSTEKLHVNSRVMIDTAFFKENNPMFPSRKHDTHKPKSGVFGFKSASIKGTVLDSNKMKESDLFICSHLVYGFVLNCKLRV